MPSKSKAQQKFMGMVHSLKKGDTKPSDVSKDVKDAAKSMSKKDAKDYASTKHKGLPNRVKQEILDRLKTEYAFYHTQTRARKRDHDDDNNLGKNKKYSGQPDLEEGMVQPKRGHDYFQLTKDVELDYISGHTGLGLTTPGVRLHNTISQFKGKKGAYMRTYSSDTALSFYYSSESPSTSRPQIIGTDVGAGYIICTISYKVA